MKTSIAYHSQSYSMSSRDIFINALKSSTANEQPYRHFIIEELFDRQLIQDLADLPLHSVISKYNEGTREEFNSVRQYLNPNNIAKYPAARDIVDVLLDKQVIKTIEQTGNISLQNSLLRLEYAIDQGEFWLKPHTDLGVKLFTMLLYLTDAPSCRNWGTDIYVDADHHWMTVPYIQNSALIFFPNANTWHGFEPREINGVRRSLIINYVTQDWQNRDELVHPTHSVY